MIILKTTHTHEQVKKVGGLNKAKKVVRTNNIKENLEANFIKQANKVKIQEMNEQKKLDRKAKRLAHREAKKQK